MASKLKFKSASSGPGFKPCRVAVTYPRSRCCVWSRGYSSVHSVLNGEVLRSKVQFPTDPLLQLHCSRSSWILCDNRWRPIQNPSEKKFILVTFSVTYSLQSILRGWNYHIILRLFSWDESKLDQSCTEYGVTGAENCLHAVAWPPDRSAQSDRVHSAAHISAPREASGMWA